MLLEAANDLAGLEAKLEEWKGDEAVEEEVHEAKAKVGGWFYWMMLSAIPGITIAMYYR